MSMFSGDSEAFFVSCMENKIARPFVTGDVVYFTVKKNISNEEKVLQKVITSFVDGKALIELSPADTKELTPMRYIYDAKIILAGGFQKTVLGPAEFELKAVVTDE